MLELSARERTGPKSNHSGCLPVMSRHEMGPTLAANLRHGTKADYCGSLAWIHIIIIMPLAHPDGRQVGLDVKYRKSA